ncbi:MAG: hypothetical protein JOS17DRAFT_750370 [Linnemannia elongata]|nr:MAG: hypothetical protein JOS17DRAFT_750370 [Linnemannia elongata]
MALKSLFTLATAFALLAVLAEAHSWADCVDWRFNDPAKPGWTDKHGKCHGWARQYPVNSGVRFGDLDSSSPNRHYQQDPEDFLACSDKFHGNEPGADETRQNPISRAYGGRFGTMASVKAGDEICPRTHAVKNEQDRGVFINMPPTPTIRDPNQSQLMKMTIAKLEIPDNRVAGTYMIQWRWELNNNEWYTSCWDLAVTAKDSPVQPGQPGEPLAED